MKKLKNIKLAIIFLLLLIPMLTFSQSRPLHEIHSMMIYNFTKYIQWPGYEPSQDFIVGVIGHEEVFNTLSAWYHGKERGNKKFVIKYYSSSAEIGDCHILYVSTDYSKEFDEIKSKVGEFSTLVITNKPGLGKQGSCINFIQENNKLGIELNQSAMNEASLKVSSQLTSIAKLI